MKKILLILVFVFVCECIYAYNPRIDVDKVLVDDFSDLNKWSQIHKSKLSISEDLTLNDWPSYTKVLKWIVYADRPRNSLIGICREDLDYKLPKSIVFNIFAEYYETYIIGLEDSEGNRAVYISPKLKIMQWNLLKININDFRPFAIGAPNIKDIKKIFIGIREADGYSGKHNIYISPIEFDYEYGTYYPCPTLEEINVNVEKINEQINIISEKITKLNEKNISCRYELSNLTIMKEYLKEIKKNCEKKALGRGGDQSEYLLKIGYETIDKLTLAENDPNVLTNYTPFDASKIYVKDGIVYSEDRPVFLTGIMGWFDYFWDPKIQNNSNDSEYKIINEYGFNFTSFEWPMTERYDPNRTEFYKQKVKAIEDNNLVFKVLLSPHYISQEEYKAFPGLDPLGYRQAQGMCPYNMESDDLKKLISDHLDNCMPVIKDSPNLLGYDLENELYQTLAPDFDYNKYKNKDNEYENLWIGDLEYTQENVYDFINFYKNEVEKYDNTKPIWSKLLGWFEIPSYKREKVDEILSGQGYYTFTDPVDRSGDLACDMWIQSMILDSYRGFNKNKIIVDGESHLNICLWDSDVINEKYMNLCLWNGYVRGKDASGLWCWSSYNEYEFNHFYNQPWAIHAAAKATMDVNRVAEYVVPFAKQVGEYAVYYGGSGFEQLYKALNFADTNFDIITDDTVLKNLPKYKFVIILDDATPNKKTLDLLRKNTQILSVNSELSCKKMYPIITKKIKETQCQRMNFNKWGVESRFWNDKTQTCYYVANYNKENVIVDLPNESIDLLTGKKYKTLTMEPMDFYLLKY